MENNELDLVVFEDDKGNEITMEVLEYLFYEGHEYALLAEYEEDSECDNCDGGDCDGCAAQRDAFVMEVRPVEGDEESEEFVPVEDEKLAEKLMDIFENSDFDEEDFDDFDDADDE